MPNSRARAVVTAAGPVAEAVIAEENRWWRFASRSDIDNLYKYARETGAGNDEDAVALFIHAAGRRAIALLGERKIWQKVEGLAKWLECERTLRFRPPPDHGSQRTPSGGSVPKVR